YEGNPIRTDSRMQMYAWWFESKTTEFPEVKTYNLSSKSLAIPNIEFKDISNIFALDDFPFTRSQIAGKIEEAQNSTNNSLSNKRLENAQKFISKLLSEKNESDFSEDERSVLEIYSDSKNQLVENLKKITKI
ncbi:MAG: hypothetical protein K5839_06260, partial [Treponemataceae bacterium]|nr:hypothetical protein [Treponemataceae bacterium]